MLRASIDFGSIADLIIKAAERAVVLKDESTEESDTEAAAPSTKPARSTDKKPEAVEGEDEDEADVCANPVWCSHLLIIGWGRKQTTSTTSML